MVLDILGFRDERAEGLVGGGGICAPKGIRQIYQLCPQQRPESHLLLCQEVHFAVIHVHENQYEGNEMVLRIDSGGKVQIYVELGGPLRQLLVILGVATTLLARGLRGRLSCAHGRFEELELVLILARCAALEAVLNQIELIAYFDS